MAQRVDDWGIKVRQRLDSIYLSGADVEMLVPPVSECLRIIDEYRWKGLAGDEALGLLKREPYFSRGSVVAVHAQSPAYGEVVALLWRGKSQNPVMPDTEDGIVIVNDLESGIPAVVMGSQALDRAAAIASTCWMLEQEDGVLASNRRAACLCALPKWADQVASEMSKRYPSLDVQSLVWPTDDTSPSGEHEEPRDFPVVRVPVVVVDGEVGWGAIDDLRPRTLRGRSYVLLLGLASPGSKSVRAGIIAEAATGRLRSDSGIGRMVDRFFRSAIGHPERTLIDDSVAVVYIDRDAVAIAIGNVVAQRARERGIGQLLT